MRYIYAAIAMVCTVLGFLLLARAGTALHEIEAFMLFLIAAVLMACSEICEAAARLDRAADKSKTAPSRIAPDAGAHL